ncbi:hypothetical protein Hamer_G005704 [Homarus americanus]|uniref:Uncharacterized protein n=1 Tax=Homarus americanus TaxID=6706 RepID=A0A8J5JFQ5_HOMAM|nr:hypothetical protein Hamer_G005704 [Homarus americanus]
MTPRHGTAGGHKSVKPYLRLPTTNTKSYSPSTHPTHGKSNLTEADLAVLESMMVAQEAEVEEMVFAQALAEMQAEAKSLKSDGDAQNVDKSLKIQKLTKSYVTAEKPIIPVKTPVVSSANVTASAAGKATDTGQHLGELTKRVADVASTMASTLESITAVAEGLEGSHLSSDEGEEQLMLMRDSPRWEDEEIQAEDTDEPRAIKAEIKLLVKTTEVGKESIEIRSIREFVECEDKNLSGFGGVVQSPTLECGQLTSMGDRVYTLQRASPDVHSPSPRFVRPQQSSTDSSYTEPTQDEFDLMAQVRGITDLLPSCVSDGGLHGGCPEAQGMDWEGKSVDSMYTETVVQAKLSMLPEVDTSEGVAPTSFSSSTLPPAAPPLSTASLCTDLPHPSNIQPQAQTFQDLTQQPSQTYLNLEPSHLHDSHSFELQGFDTSPSSATKLSDHLFLEKGYVNGAEATTSQLVASPSFASLQSESVAPITGTDEIAAASVTFNTSSAFMSLGPISPTENSSEDHAEIDRTSTEISPDSVRFEQDILDTRTEDEAPDLDDDLFPASPVLGPELSERIFSVEATEDTDITTPMEMRDSHTERDASASNLEFGDDKDGTDGKSDLKESLHFETKDDSIAYLAEEIKEIQNKVNRLQEQVKSQIDPIAARSEVEMILNTMEDIREAVGDSKIENNPEFNNMAQDILSSISSISETVAEMMQTLRLSDPEYADFRSRDEKITAKRTDSTVVETGSAYDGSPSDTNLRDQSFSDLLDSEELNRDSLEDDFDRLAADLSLSPKTDLVVEISPKVTSTAAPSDVLSSPVSSNVYPSKPPDALQATQREPAEGGTSSQQAVQSVTDEVVCDETQQTDGDSKVHDECVKTGETVGLVSEVRTDSEYEKSFGSLSTMSDKSDDELIKFNKCDKTCEPDSSVSTFITHGNENSSKPTHDEVDSVVVRRESSRSGPRPTTFPLCLLQPEVVSSSPEAQQYFRQQQEVLEEMGRQGHLQMDVTDLRDLTSPESLAESNEFEDNEAEEMDRDARRNHRKLVKSSSSYENLYDGADLKAAESEDAPPTLQLANSLGDPFTTKTQLPPDMCSSFENLYMKAQKADDRIVHEADLLSAAILEEAVHEAVQEGQLQSTTLNIMASPASSGTESPVQGLSSDYEGILHSSSEEFGTAGILVM